MFNRLVIAATLVALPCTAAIAQRGGGSRTGADRPTEMFDKQNEPKGPSLRARDVEDLSAVKLLIDKRKDLKLTDEQLSALKDSESKVKETNAPFLKMVDSLVHEMRPGLNTSDEDRARIGAARKALQNVVTTIRDNYVAAAKAGMAQFTPEQLQQATDLMNKQREDGDKRLREKLSGGEQRGG